RELERLLRPLERAASPFADEVPREFARNAHWVEPRLVGEVRCAEWTGDGPLRHPSWRGLRDGKAPAPVRRRGPCSPRVPDRPPASGLGDGSAVTIRREPGVAAR